MSTKSIIKRLFVIGMGFKQWFVVALAVSIALALVSTYRPVLTKNIIDYDILLLKSESALLNSMILLFTFVLVEVLLHVLLIYFSNFVAQNVIRDIREKLYHNLIHFKTSFFDKTAIGNLVTKAVGDVETVAVVYTDGFLMIFGDILKLALAVFFMYRTNPYMAYLSCILFPFMFFITRFFQKRMKKSFAEERRLTSEQNSFVQERLSGMSIIQVFNREYQEFKNFDKINIQLREALLKTVFYFSLFFPVVEILSSVFIVSFLFYAGYGIFSDQQITPGDVVAFVQFIPMLLRPLRQIADRFNNIQRGLVGAERVLEIIDDDSLNTVNNGTIKKEYLGGKIEFRDVYFSYDENQKILKGINFQVHPGQTVAIVGATGAGKSTVIQLITRLYDINSGKILIDDIDIKDYELYHLRSLIGVVLQDVFLFHGTIFENLSLGDERITLDKVKQAAKEIGVDDFIEKLPGAYNFIVSERGASISMGQRQLLSFLRAYLSDPEVLILDEATSSIDYESEKLIQRATEKMTKKRTSIIIAHRLSTIEKADKIIVMDKGKIVEEGFHKELLKKGGYYSTLYRGRFDQQN